jgi:oligosaccharide repeat unit polymerase
MTHLLIATLAAFVAYFFTVIRPTGYLTASALFAYIQVLMAVGTFPMLDESLDADVLYGKIVAYSVIAFMVVSFFASLRAPFTPRSDPAGTIVDFKPLVTTWAFTALSILVVVFYFRSVGYSGLLEGLRNTFSGGDADVAGLRLDSYAGAKNFFPGFVNQFKNALLPGLVVVILTHRARSGQKKRFTSALLILIAGFGLLGTGQRGAFVQFLVVALIYVYLLNGRRFPKKVIRYGLVAFFVFLVATMGLGRSSDTLARDAGFGDRLVSATGDFRDRLLTEQQQSGVAGFRYIYNQPIQNGREWMLSLQGLGPGSRGSDLSNRIFETLYGSPRGTSPPSVWGSVYHNFGNQGVALAPVLLAMLLAGFTRRGTSSRPRSPLELVGIAGTFTVFGFWAAGDPTFLLNAGLFVYLLMWFFGAQATRRALKPKIGENRLDASSGSWRMIEDAGPRGRPDQRVGQAVE